jgi:hypothetical protein
LFQPVKLLTVSELKADAGKIFDRAIKGEPQFVVRAGAVVPISKAALLTGVEDRPPGYFAEAYPDRDPERTALEKAMAKTRQRLER